MVDIYRHALVTIAAACATSGDSGLLLPRSNSKAVEIPYYTKDGIHEGNFCATPREVQPFTSEVHHGPLQTRAWALQERYLSHGSIHYGRTQLFWECQTIVWEESSDIGYRAYDTFGLYVSDGYLASLSSSTWDTADPLAERPVVTRNEYTNWYMLVLQ